MSTAAATPGCSGLNLVEGRKPLLPKVKGGKGRDAVPPLQGASQSTEHGSCPHPPATSVCPGDPPLWPPGAFNAHCHPR